MSALTIERIERLSQAVREFDLLQHEQDLFAALETAVSAIERPASNIAAVGSLLESTELGDGVSLDLADVRKRVAKVQKEVEAWDPRRLRDGGTLAALGEAVSQLELDLQTEAQRRWREFKDSNPIPGIGELTELLDALGIEQRLILGINNALRRLERTADRPYPTVEEFEKYVEDLEKARQGASQIGLEGAWPLSVTNFFQQAAVSGAPLGLLTGEVLEWLDEHDYAKYFRIVPDRG